MFQRITLRVHNQNIEITFVHSQKQYFKLKTVQGFTHRTSMEGQINGTNTRSGTQG